MIEQTSFNRPYILFAVLTVASLQELHLTTRCDALPSRLIIPWQTRQLIEATPDAPLGTYGGGRSSPP